VANLQVKQPALLLGTRFRFWLLRFESVPAIVQKKEKVDCLAKQPPEGLEAVELIMAGRRVRGEEI